MLAVCLYPHPPCPLVSGILPWHHLKLYNHPGHSLSSGESDWDLGSLSLFFPPLTICLPPLSLSHCLASLYLFLSLSHSLARFLFMSEGDTSDGWVWTRPQTVSALQCIVVSGFLVCTAIPSVGATGTNPPLLRAHYENTVNKNREGKK